VGRDDDVLFHNHVGEGFRYGYPEIQYKLIGGKAAIVAVGDGVVAAFNEKLTRDLDVKIGTKAVTLELESAEMQTCDFVSTSDSKTFDIHHWLPLNQDNLDTFVSCDSMIGRVEMLQKILVGNILSMAKGLDIHLFDRVELVMNEVKETGYEVFKNQRMRTFDATFHVNMELPNYVGLGKGASLGYGTIIMKNNKK
jgi:hypothetical protein